MPKRINDLSARCMLTSKIFCTANSGAPDVAEWGEGVKKSGSTGQGDRAIKTLGR